MTALHLCYGSLLDPLIQTQVVAYLEGLARAGYRMVLLTFEPRALTYTETREWRERLAAKGITWYWVRYHKRPSVPATAWDILTGIAVGLRLVRRHKVALLHARSHVPGLMALGLKRLTGVKLLFDLRGFLAEEYVDVGTWPANGMLYRTTKRVECALVKAADGIVVLTHKAADLLNQWYAHEVIAKPLQVIPCCVDLRHIPRRTPTNGPRLARDERTTFVYVGKLAGWYLLEEMGAFVATAVQMIPELRWQIWTQSDATALRQQIAAQGLDGRVTIGRVPPEALPAELAKADAALSFIRPTLSKLASSPTKIGEYLAAGLPVVSSTGIGDLDALLAGQSDGSGAPVGVLVREFSEEAYREALPQLLELIQDPDTSERCRAAAEEHLDLEGVGWPRYRQLYRTLIGA